MNPLLWVNPLLWPFIVVVFVVVLGVVVALLIGSVIREADRAAGISDDGDDTVTLPVVPPGRGEHR